MSSYTVDQLLADLAPRFEHVTLSEADMHDYQEQAVEFLKANPFALLFIDIGMGKTAIGLTLIVFLLQRFLTEKILIIAPVRVAAQTWPNEIVTWGHIAHLTWQVIRAEDDDGEVIATGRRALLERRASITEEERARAAEIKADALFFALSEDEIKRAQSAGQRYLSGLSAKTAQKARTAKKEELRLQRMKSPRSVHIIDREHIDWLVDQYSEVVTVKGKQVRKVTNWPYDTVIIDDASAKDHTTGRFKALNDVRPYINRLHQLTGSPASEDYMGLFAMIYLADRGERFGRVITHYRERYFVYNHRNFTYKARPEAASEIGKKIADISMEMKAEKYLKSYKDYEPIFLPRRIKMHDYQLAEYKKFSSTFIFTLPEDGGIIEAETAAALSGKLVQLSSGALYDKKGNTHVFHDHVLDDLESLVEELKGEPLIVAYWYRSSLARLRKRFPKFLPMDASGKLIKPWNDGKLPGMFLHPAGAGHGLNMQAGPGHDIYYFDPPWRYELFYQIYGRLARQGQKQRVRVHTPRVFGTAHELVYRRLDVKRDAEELLLRYAREERKRLALRDVEEMMA